MISSLPVTDEVAAVSCGLYNNEVVLDLDYEEDSTAGADANFVMTGKKEWVEIQGTAEDKPFSQEQFLRLMALAQKGILELIEKQRSVLKI